MRELHSPYDLKTRAETHAMINTTKRSRAQVISILETGLRELDNFRLLAEAEIIKIKGKKQNITVEVNQIVRIKRNRGLLI